MRWAAALLLFTATAAHAQTPAPPPAPAQMETIYQGEATSILGRTINGPDGKTVGRIVDVLVDEMGQPRAAVLDVGGFMGIGNRRIAVAWRALHFVPDSARGTITLEMTADQIVSTPEFKQPGPPVTIAAPPAAAPDPATTIPK